MNTIIKKFLAAGAGALAIAASGVQAAVIDDFDGTGTFDLDAPQTDTSVGNSSSGFARLLTSITSGPDTNVRIDAGATLGTYAHSQDSGVTGFSRIDYLLSGVDLTEGGSQNAIRMELAAADLEGLVGLIVEGVTVSLSTTDIVLGTGIGVFPPGFADFVFSDFSGVDFTNVNQVSVFIDGRNQEDLDARIDRISTACSDLTASGVSSRDNIGQCEPVNHVPSPTPLTLIALVMFGIGSLRRLIG